MSDTIHLACVECKKSLWIGQGGYAAPARAFLYDSAAAEFAAFYDEHLGHDVRFVNTRGLDALDPCGDFDDGEGES